MTDVTQVTRMLTMVGRATGRVLAAIEHDDRLDPLAQSLTKTVQKLVPEGPLRDLLHGAPLGHPAHPFLVQIPLGTWTSAAVLDMLPFGWFPATALIGVGTVAAVPAAVTGSVDWSAGHPEQQRVGLVHWAANATAVVLYSASLAARLTGHKRVGKRLAFAGFAAVSVGGYIGGHLAYRQASGANHTEDVPHLVKDGWHEVATLAELPEHEPQRRLLDDVPLMLYREGDRVRALANACSHLSGPLHEGEIEDDPELGACVTCPWHGSTFALADGAVVHGPATSPQPSFTTRVRDGRVEVSLPGASG
ncbi:Rieske 2Fe-2S domain-containing protein [Gryllotalpicola reticulitermitis]|uniref:Rieske 2Fe-2S domain-containing protein n=1 Tax=Gryllotalpicola reticulitermitis TaxID=1184153 RepID=A0ABV8Q766_9MICO